MKCSLCGENVPEGRGKMFVRINGQVSYFCNSKCEKNWKMGRAGKALRWTKRFKEER